MNIFSLAGSPALSRHTGRVRSHGGFTLVELLVVIAIIGTLVALLLPAVQSAREAARKNTCLSNMKNLAQGIINYETSKGKYPGYVQPLKRGKDQNGDNIYLSILVNSASDSKMNSTTLAIESVVSWAAKILPEIEGQATYDTMLDVNVVPGDLRAVIKPNELFACPSDTDAISVTDNAVLSFSANAGAWDADNSGDYIKPGINQGDTKDNGIFHNHTLGSVTVSMSYLSKGSGATNTLLLTENIHKETDDSSISKYCWMGVNGLSPAGQEQDGEQQFGVVWVANKTPAIGSAAAFQVPFSTEDQDIIGFPAMETSYARPASNHSGGVFNIAYADGHGLSIDPSIDYTVYQRLLTVKQRECEDPRQHYDQASDTPSEIGMFRRLPPLSSSDL